MLDSGSTITIIDRNFAKNLGIRGSQIEMSVNGLWGRGIQARCDRTSFFVKGTFGCKSVEHAITTPNFDLPYQTLTCEVTRRVADETGVHVEPYYRARPLLLIGQDNWHLLTYEETIPLAESGLAVSRSALGWTVHGYLNLGVPKTHYVNAQLSHPLTEEMPPDPHARYEELNKLVHNYFFLDNLGVSASAEKRSRDENAWKILRETTRKIGSAWETGLLWRSENIPNIDSRATALSRLRSLEKRQDRDPNFAALYYKEMEHLIESGYARKVSPDEQRPRVWYLPHFGVTNKNKPGKVRIVFDAAAKTNGVSLNDQLDAGPTLLESIVGVLLRYREQRYAVVADIKEMFLQGHIIKADQGAQRFLYRGADRDRAPDTYEMTRIIFGSTSSPCSAVYIKNTNAETFANDKPDAVRSIIRNTYMDDYCASGKSIDEVRQLVRDVITINKEANFTMHGWASNEPRTIASVREDRKLATGQKVKLGDGEERVLGIYWDCDTDRLRFNVGLDKIHAKILRGDQKPTKREVFSIAMSIYDPLGILSPFTIRAKILMQNIWRSGVGWDQRIREEEFQDWVLWVQDLEKMQTCSIPRCYIKPTMRYGTSQLHIFCDASLQAFAAVAYLRTVTNDGQVSVSLVMSKTRVAPVKPLTVPRLELQGGVLGARLAKTICEELIIKIDRKVFWTDSATLLQWLRSEPRRRVKFVENRLGEIGELTHVNEWRWVPTKMNPADDGTRASTGPMRNSDRWVIGPDFLYGKPDTWPREKKLTEKDIADLERLEARKEFTGLITAATPQVSTRTKILGWNGLLRLAKEITIGLNSWWGKLASAEEQRTPRFLYTEDVAEKFWYRQVQSDCFAIELNAIRNHKPLPKNSKIAGLAPFLDQEGLLRANGRAKRIQGVKFENYPIILDAQHVVAKLLIKQFHQRYLHANNETVVNELRQIFYIFGLRSRLRWIAKQCIICRHRRAKPESPPMSDLPKGRVAIYERPFTHCGVDYFGPMCVKIGRRREKRWGVIFTCLTTRAIHLELASTLDASSSIMALQRLGSRRGFPAHIYSDNGTNFRRASKELRDAIAEIDQNKLTRLAAKRRVKWLFNPPEAPHMGGAW